MKYAALRIIMVGIMALCLVGIQPAGTAQAVAESHWAARPPSIDGAISGNEWWGAACTVFTNFRVCWQNDSQFMYLWINVFGDSPASPSPISGNEDFTIGFDIDQNGATTSEVDLAYTLNFTLPSYPLWQQKSTGGTTWNSGTATPSYAAAGFGKDADWLTPHRIYEAAIRLSDLGALPGETVKTGFWVSSANPSFTEGEPQINNMSSYHTLGLASPRAAFIYNTTDDHIDGLAFSTVLSTYGSFTTDLIALGNVATTDFSPYQAILLGKDTTDIVNHTWLGSAAAEARIQQSGVPVLGIGKGGLGLFSDLGLDINFGSVAGVNNIVTVDLAATDSPAWSFPNNLPNASPFVVYSSMVYNDAVYLPAVPLNRLTVLATQTNASKYSPLLAQEKDGVCYTEWGYASSPQLLTVDGKKLFTNMVANPICMPSVLYLGGGDNTLRDGITTMMRSAGFYVAYNLASDTASLSFTDIDLIVVGWDTIFAWNTPANVNAIRNSRLPVLAMGEGGDHLFVSLELTYNNSFTLASTPQKTAAITNPLLPVMRAPYPISVDSTLVAPIDGSAAGVTEFLPAAKSPLVIGNLITDPAYHGILTQASNGVCYSYWGFHNYESTMTVLAKNLFRNLAASPQCNYAQFVPQTRK